MKIKVRCICGLQHTTEVDKGKTLCPCGAEVYARINDDGYIIPWVTIPEDSLDERKSSGHKVLYQKPKAIL